MYTLPQAPAARKSAPDRSLARIAELIHGASVREGFPAQHVRWEEIKCCRSKSPKRSSHAMAGA